MASSTNEPELLRKGCDGEVKHAHGEFAETEVIAQQLGYVDSDGVIHVLEDQPRLTVGDDYLLATNFDRASDV